MWNLIAVERKLNSYIQQNKIELPMNNEVSVMGTVKISNSKININQGTN